MISHCTSPSNRAYPLPVATGAGRACRVGAARHVAAIEAAPHPTLSSSDPRGHFPQFLPDLPRERPIAVSRAADDEESPYHGDLITRHAISCDSMWCRAGWPHHCRSVQGSFRQEGDRSTQRVVRSLAEIGRCGRHCFPRYHLLDIVRFARELFPHSRHGPVF